jgi:hypothetical protein
VVAYLKRYWCMVHLSVENLRLVVLPSYCRYQNVWEGDDEWNLRELLFWMSMPSLEFDGLMADCV